MAEYLIEHKPEIAIICCCSIDLLSARSVIAYPAGLVAVYDGLYEWDEPDVDPEENLVREMVELSLQSFAKALDYVIEARLNVEDPKTLATALTEVI